MPVSAVPPRHLRRRLARVLRFGAAVSIIIAAVAVLLLFRGEATLHASRLIAVALGIGLVVLLAAAIMLFFPGSLDRQNGDHGASPSESDEQ